MANNYNLVWNVYHHNCNQDKIEVINLLDYAIFKELLTKERRKRIKISKKDLEEKLEKELRYYFWSKCEAEVVVTAWAGGNAKKKIDIYEQVKNNWSVFLDYCYRYVTN